MKNITLSLDDEVYRSARIRAAEENTSVSALVKQLLTAKVENSGARSRPAAILERAAELRAVTQANAHTPAEFSQREGRDERDAPNRGAKAALLLRLHSEPVVAVGRWSRDELYEDER